MGGSGDHDIQRHGIAGYEDLTPIGSGGSSSVYRATDVRHQRLVAVKVLDVPTADQPGRSAFQREVEAIGKVGHHPYVVTVLGSGFTSSGHAFLVLPFFENGTIGQLVDEQGPLTWPAAVDLGIKLSSAVETVHRAGIVHRDIKPGNVFVGVTPEHPLLGDFGISSTVDPGATKTTTMAVTFGYSAPEVLDDQRPTPASDIYSLGMTVFRLIQGLHAYYAESPAAIVRKVLADSDQPRLSAGVPVELAAVVADALNKDPADRPPSALALARQLQELQMAHGLTVTDVVVADEPPRKPVDSPPAESVRDRATLSTDRIESTMLAAIRDRQRPDSAGDAAPKGEPAPSKVDATGAVRGADRAGLARPARRVDSERADTRRADVGAILAAALHPEPTPGGNQAPPQTDTGEPATIDLPTVVRPRQPRDTAGPSDHLGEGSGRSRRRWLPIALVLVGVIIAAVIVAGVTVALL